METAKELAIVILAAGKGTRMKSDQAKVLHLLAGRPLLAHVLDLAVELAASRTIVVVGHQADQVRAAFARQPGLSFVLQEPQLGTGHAVMAAAPALAGFAGPVLILYGDVPGLKAATVQRLLAEHAAAGNALTVLAMRPADPGAYGRLILDQAGRLQAIVEFRDASQEQRAIDLVNSGIYVVESGPLLDGLNQLRPDNDQGEYYLTDLVGLLAGQGLPLGWALCPDPAEVAGINSQQELEAYSTRLASGGEGG